MKPKDIVLTASANLFRSKLRSFLTIIAIFVGSFTLMLTTGLGAGISNYINQQVANLGAKNVLIVQNSGNGSSFTDTTPKKYDPTKKIISFEGPGVSVNALTDGDVTKIKSIPGITKVTPSLNVIPSYIKGPSATKYQIAVSQFITGSTLDLAAGDTVNNESSQNQVLIPLSYVSSLGFGSASSAIGKTVNIGINDAFGTAHEVNADVVGVLRPGLTGGSSIDTNPSLLRALYNYQIKGLPHASVDNYREVFAYFSSDATTNQVASLKAALQKDGYSAQTVQDQIGSFEAVISGIILVLDGFAVIALLAASFGIINTLLMAVQERTKEIGLMKAMGMGNGGIFFLFSIEAMLLGLWGSLIGVLCAFVIGKVIDHIVSSGPLKELVGLQLLAFPGPSMVTIIIVVMLIAFAAGSLPAYKASRQNPIDSLRYE